MTFFLLSLGTLCIFLYYLYRKEKILRVHYQNPIFRKDIKFFKLNDDRSFTECTANEWIENGRSIVLKGEKPFEGVTLEIRFSGNDLVKNEVNVACPFLVSLFADPNFAINLSASPNYVTAEQNFNKFLPRVMDILMTIHDGSKCRELVEKIGKGV